MQVIQVYQAHQWHKNGDHPDDYKNPRMYQSGDSIEERPGSWFKENKYEGEVVRYFRRPDVPGDQMCIVCNRVMNEHGWIDGSKNKGLEGPVCPGDWIMNSELGIYVPIHDALFKKGYREYIWESASRIGS